MTRKGMVVVGADKVDAKLTKIGKKIHNPRAFYKRTTIYLDRWVMDNLKGEGSKVGGWTPFKIGGRFTGKGDNRKFDSSAKLLQDTGKLRASLRHQSTMKGAKVFTRLRYAVVHDQGSGRLPKRQLIPKWQQVRNPVMKILQKYVREVIR